MGTEQKKTGREEDLKAEAVQIVTDLESGTAAPTVDNGDYVRQLEATRKAASEGATADARKMAEEEFDRRREFLLARKAGRPLPPIRSSPITLAEDPTIPLNEAGEPLDPNRVYRWVRTIDGTGEASGKRVGDFRRQGYQPEKAADGQPITQFRHILMSATPDAERARRATALKDLVTQDRRKEQYHSAIDGINRAAGSEVVQPYDGGSTRSRTLEPMTESEVAGFAERG